MVRSALRDVHGAQTFAKFHRPNIAKLTFHALLFAASPFSRGRGMRLRTSSYLSIAVLLSASSGAFAATPPADPVVPQSLYATPSVPLVRLPGADRAITRGGALRLRWNNELLADLGLGRVEALGEWTTQSEAGFDLPLTKDTRFDVDGTAKTVYAVAGGKGGVLGGFRFVGGAHELTWTDASFAVRPGDALRIDFRGADGTAPFYVDRLMYEFIDGGSAFRIRSADLRLSAELATRLGHPEAADTAIAELRLLAPLAARDTAAVPKSCAAPTWPGLAVPGVPDAIYEADVFMTTFSAQYSRCRSCDGPGGANDGEIVFTPSSTLRNNVNNGTAAPTVAGDPLGTSTALYSANVSWRTKFSGVFDPYGTDQHPYLIWNIYRLDTDGSITHIGRSGLKHAFLTTNVGCASGENCTNQILGRSCGDTYGTGNNDSSSDLGPRSELLAATGQWGRCGSIYDTNCDGAQNSSGNTSFDQRLIVRESAVDAAANPGATWLFESWYVVRDDINIYNTMGTRSFNTSWTGSTWPVTAGATAMKLGPAIDRWYESATPAPIQKLNTELAVKVVSVTQGSENIVTGGHAKVAVKVTDAGGGLFRYDYAVMNFDFSRSVLDATTSAPNLRLLRNNGIGAFHIPRDPLANVTQVSFADGDGNAANDWVGTINADTIDFAPPVGVNAPQNWGNMFRFTVIADKAPATANVSLDPVEPGSPASFNVASLTVGDQSALLKDGFEGP